MGLFNLFNPNPNPQEKPPGVFDGTGANGVPQGMFLSGPVNAALQDKATQDQQIQRSQTNQMVSGIANRRQAHQDVKNAAFQKQANPLGGGAIQGINAQAAGQTMPSNFDFIQAQRGLYG